MIKNRLSRWPRFPGFSVGLIFLFFFILPVILVFHSPARAQFGGGGGGGSGGGNISRTLPSTSVTPLAPEAPAPWGTDPATVSGLIVEDIMTSPGFLQQKVTTGSGDTFFYQSFSASDFSMESYSKFGNSSTNDPSGNLVFNQVISDPAFGMSEKTTMNGFRQPISIHSDITEKNVSGLTDGLNQMDMHFSQIPFLDTSTSKVAIRQDIGVWMTSFTGVMPNDITQSETFTLSPGDLSHEVAASIPSGGGSSGTIDWWNDLEAVKIIDPANNQLLNFSRCNDFGDPTGRMGFNNNQGTRGGCSGSGSSSTRPAIPSHEGDDFQLTPINWDRWGGSGTDSFSSGLSTNFPNGSGGGGGFGR